MTAVKIIQVLMQYSLNKDLQTARMLRPGCSQAADAVSAKTQIKMEDAPRLLKIPKSECPDIWIRPPRHK